MTTVETTASITGSAPSALTRPAPIPGAAQPRPLLLAGVLALWAGGVALLAATGALGVLEPYGVPVALVASIALPILTYYRSATLRATIDAIGIRGLTSVNLARYLGAAWILTMGANGLMNPLLATLAGYGDIIAATASVLALTSRPTVRRFAAAHLIGLADFATSITAGLVMLILDPTSLAGGTALGSALVLFFIIGFYSTNSVAALTLLRRTRSL